MLQLGLLKNNSNIIKYDMWWNFQDYNVAQLNNVENTNKNKFFLKIPDEKWKIMYTSIILRQRKYNYTKVIAL